MLFFYDTVDQRPYVWFFERAEPESCTPRKQGGREFMGVISDNAEPSVGGVFLHDPSQRHLSRRSHGVRLIKDDKLEGADGCGV